jgi:hypothetical protein
MVKYVGKVVVVDTITFDEFLELGKSSVSPQYLHNGYAWHFLYKGFPVTHEHNALYLVSTPDGIKRFYREDLLVTDETGKIFPIDAALFKYAFVSVD